MMQKPIAPVHKFRIRLVNKNGTVLYEERPLTMTIGDKLTYGPGAFEIHIDGKPSGVFECSVEFTWMPPAPPPPVGVR